MRREITSRTSIRSSFAPVAVSRSSASSSAQPELVVLHISINEPDWPDAIDAIDEENVELHDPWAGKGGNNIRQHPARSLGWYGGTWLEREVDGDVVLRHADAVAKTPSAIRPCSRRGSSQKRWPAADFQIATRSAPASRCIAPGAARPRKMTSPKAKVPLASAYGPSRGVTMPAAG